MEYKCTSEETPQTTTNITVDKGSNKKPQLTTSNSEVIQGVKHIVQLEPKTAVS